MPKIKKKCKICGCEILAYRQRFYCDECQLRKSREQSRQYYYKKLGPGYKPKKRKKIADNYISSLKHFTFQEWKDLVA